MLPYTPLHHLLLPTSGAPLVMTSGNVSDEPIAYGDDDACERLGAHRRRASWSTTGPIHIRTDDSVVRSRRRGRPRAAAAPLARVRARERSAAAGRSAGRCWPAAPS